jgi:predicted transposase/invertase (TIGR01784 family)
MEKSNVRKVKGATGQQYAELLCDFMFKRLFGSEANKDVLISFLNVLLEDVEIESVDFIPTEHLGMTEDDRKVIFDISCSCKDGRTFIIEMQKGYQKHFRKRAVYYTTYPISQQGRMAHDKYVKEKAAACQQDDAKFNWDYDLTPVTVVAILNFQFEHDDDWPREKYHSSYRLREDGSNEIMTDVLRFVFLELGRFKKRIWELETVFDKWMYLLKHMHEMVVIPNEFKDPLFSRLFLLAEINNFTSDELQQYQKSLENMGEFENIITSTEERAREAGRVEGRAEGLTEGGHNKAKEIAANMLSAGMPIEQVAQFTGLEISEIDKLSL